MLAGCARSARAGAAIGRSVSRHAAARRHSDHRAVPAARDHAGARARVPARCSCLWSEARTGDLVSELKEGRLDAVAARARGRHRRSRRTRSSAAIRSCSRRRPTPPAREALQAPSARRPRTAQTVLLLDDGHCFRDQALQLLHAGERRRAQLSRDEPGDAGADGERRRRRDAAAVACACRSRTVAVSCACGAFTAPEPGRTIALAWRRGPRSGSRSSRWRRRYGRRCPRSPRRVAVAARDHGSRPQRDTDRTDPIPDGTPITRGSTPRWDADHAGPRIRLPRGRGLHGFVSHGTRITRISRIRSPRDADYADSFLQRARGFTDLITTGRGLRGFVSHGTRITRISRIITTGRGLRRSIPPTGRRSPGCTDPITNGDAVPRGVIFHGTRITRIHSTADFAPMCSLEPLEPLNPLNLRVAVRPSPPHLNRRLHAARQQRPVIISDFSHGALTTRVRRTPMLRLEGERRSCTSSARV